MMLIAQAGDCELVQLLLDGGADIRLEDQRGRTALAYAAREGHEAAVTTLLRVATVDNRDLALAEAAGRGHLDIVHILIRAGVNLDATAQDGTTALIAALQNGHVEVATTLVEAGADVHACRADGTTPLMHAAFRGFKGIARLLLNAAADVNRASDHGETALIFLIKDDVLKSLPHRSDGKGKAWADAAGDMLRMLVEAGADVNRSTENGDTALLLTIQLHRAFCLRPISRIYETLTVLLLQAGADPVKSERSKQTALISQEAGFNLNILTVRLLLEAGANPALQVPDPNLWAIYRFPREHSQQEVYDALSKLKLQLHYGANVDAANEKGQTTLIHAVRSMQWDVARFLLRAGANHSHEDSMGETALSWLVRQPHEPAWELEALEEVITVLLAAQADLEVVYDKKNTLILRAAQSFTGSHAVKFLLAAGANPHVSDDRGQNAVMLASKLENDIQASLTVRLFLDAGVDANTRNCDGESALTLTAYRCSGNPNYAPHCKHSLTMTLQTLLSAGADANDSYPKGKTVLMAVASRNCDHWAEIRVLIDARADIDATDEEGRTALAYCIYHGNCANIASLLAAGANPNTIDHEGRTPLMEVRHHISTNFNIDIVRQLVHAGADVNLRDARGRDALMLFLDGMDCASLPKEIEAVRILCGAGVDLGHVDENGDTALRYAESKGNLEMARLIKGEIQSRNDRAIHL